MTILINVLDPSRAEVITSRRVSWLKVPFADPSKELSRAQLVLLADRRYSYDFAIFMFYLALKREAFHRTQNYIRERETPEERRMCISNLHFAYDTALCRCCFLCEEEEEEEQRFYYK